jgi:hypothetical protein
VNVTTSKNACLMAISAASSFSVLCSAQSLVVLAVQSLMVLHMQLVAQPSAAAQVPFSAQSTATIAADKFQPVETKFSLTRNRQAARSGAGA